MQNSRVHRGNHIYRGIQFFFRHPRFPCVRKAPIDSWIAESHHRDGETDEHLLALGKTFDGMGVTVEGSKIRFLHVIVLLIRGRSMLRPYKPKTRNPKLFFRPVSRP